MREKLQAELARLSAAFGAPGFEREVRQVFRELLGEGFHYQHDHLGSIVAELPGTGPRVMIAAHLDEVGFMIKAVTAEGYLRFVPLGSLWPQVLLSGAVRIRGKLGDVRGVIGAKPPHFQQEKERRELVAVEDMFIDIAAGSSERVKRMGIGPGDPAVPDIAPVVVADGEVMLGKALDCRVGLLAVIETARRLKAAGHPRTLLAAGTAQEEIGARGGKTVAQMLHPDVCLVIEGTPADDGPGFVKHTPQGALGNGPQIRMYDPSMIGNRALIELAVATAEQLGLPYQVTVREGGGTDGGQIHLTGAGVPAMVIGIPVRYAHSQISLCSLADLEKTIDLLTAVVSRLDASVVTGLLPS
jgi:endoglucanase